MRIVDSEEKMAEGGRLCEPWEGPGALLKRKPRTIRRFRCESTQRAYEVRNQDYKMASGRGCEMVSRCKINGFPWASGSLHLSSILSLEPSSKAGRVSVGRNRGQQTAVTPDDSEGVLLSC